MMRYVCPAILVALSILVPVCMFGQATAPSLALADVTVGQNLEAAAMVTVTGPLPPAGIQVTITSNDPSRVLLSATPEGAGAKSIVGKMPSGLRELEVYVQGVEKSGTATYTATASGFSSATGKVTLGPSGVVLGGPYGIGKGSFVTTTGAGKTKIGVYFALLDSSLKYVNRQRLAGGRTVDVQVTNSNPAAGKVDTSTLKMTGGSNGATILFQAGTEGETALAVAAPPGFSTPAQVPYTTVAAKVNMPGMALTEDIMIGQNLQDGGSLGLNEPAPAGGLEVTLTCHNPDQLLLSSSPKVKGSGTLKVKIPAGESQATFYLQALAGSGTATYVASAPGYRNSRTAKINLAPTGVVIAGPLSFTRAGGSPGFVASLASHKPTSIVVYTVFLDPVTHRSADVTVQPLRAGVKMTVALVSSDPSVGTIASPVVIEENTNQSHTLFTPLKPGTTILSPLTPDGYTASINAVALKTIVTE